MEIIIEVLNKNWIRTKIQFVKFILLCSHFKHQHPEKGQYHIITKLSIISFCIYCLRSGKGVEGLIRLLSLYTSSIK